MTTASAATEETKEPDNCSEGLAQMDVKMPRIHLNVLYVPGQLDVHHCPRFLFSHCCTWSSVNRTRLGPNLIGSPSSPR